MPYLNSSCNLDGLVGSTTYIPRLNVAHWMLIVIPSVDYYTNSITTINFVVRAFDNYLAPSPSVKAVIHVDPINNAPYFNIDANGLTIEQLAKADYLLLRGEVLDPDFKFGLDVKLTVTVEGSGYLSLPFPSITTCNLTIDNLTLTCQSEITALNSWFSDKAGLLGVPFHYSTDDDVFSTIYFHVDDLGNVDKHHPPHNLSATTSTQVILSGSITSGVAVKPSSNVTSVSVGIGVGLAVLVGAMAYLYFRKKNNETDQYLAEFLSNVDTAGSNINPMYQQATKKNVNPLHKPTVQEE